MRTVVSNPAYHLIWFPVIWLEVIFHCSSSGFGELYLLRDNRKALFIGAILPLGVFATPSLTEFSPYAHYFFIVYVVRLVFELVRLSVSKLRSKAPHSYSMSAPSRFWLLMFPNLRMVSRIVQPLIVLLIGVVLVSAQVDCLLGYVLCWCGVGMFLKFQHLDVARRDARKDVEDRRSEGFENH